MATSCSPLQRQTMPRPRCSVETSPQNLRTSMTMGAASGMCKVCDMGFLRVLVGSREEGREGTDGRGGVPSSRFESSVCTLRHQMSTTRDGSQWQCYCCNAAAAAAAAAMLQCCNAAVLLLLPAAVATAAVTHVMTYVIDLSHQCDDRLALCQGERRQNRPSVLRLSHVPWKKRVRVDAAANTTLCNLCSC